MRIVTTSFGSGAQFLSAFRDDGAGLLALHVATRMPLQFGEVVVLEVRLPGLPNPELLRATVMATEGDGYLLELADEDRAAVDFLVEHAERPADLAHRRPELVTRSFERFPLALPCDWRVRGTWQHNPSATVDVSSGGAFVRTAEPPPVGTPVILAIAASEQGALELHGVVAWRRQTAAEPGMGVDFAQLTGSAARRLRELLRGASERGRVALG